MEKLNVFLCFLMLFFISFCQRGEAKKWCVANGVATDEQLSAFLDRVCAPKNTCRGIKPGKPCFLPPTIHSHASYMLNVEYRKTGICPDDIGMLLRRNPSYGRCRYR